MRIYIKYSLKWLLSLFDLSLPICEIQIENKTLTYRTFYWVAGTLTGDTPFIPLQGET